MATYKLAAVYKNKICKQAALVNKAIITPPQERSEGMLISAVYLLHHRAILAMDSNCVNQTKLNCRSSACWDIIGAS